MGFGWVFGLVDLVVRFGCLAMIWVCCIDCGGLGWWGVFLEF